MQQSSKHISRKKALVTQESEQHSGSDSRKPSQHGLPLLAWSLGGEGDEKNRIPW